MSVVAILQGTEPLSALELVLRGSLSARIVLAVTALFSLVSWLIIFWKLGQFRRVRRQGIAFVRSTERLHRLEDISRSVLRLPESPYTRLFRHGLTFFGELRPALAREGAGGVAVQGLSETQLQALRLVLEKGQAEERDHLAAGLSWLAVIGTVSPLLGLLGTVIGVMNSFLGVARSGSANIASVAPGIAEALVTTVAGLAVAIPAVIAYNYFVTRLNSVTGELEGFASEFIGLLAREGRL